MRGLSCGRGKGSEYAGPLVLSLVGSLKVAPRAYLKAERAQLCGKGIYAGF